MRPEKESSPMDWQNELLTFCQELIRIPGLSGEEAAVARLVTAKMFALGFEQVHGDDYGNIIGVRHGSQPGATVLFDGHMDVVPATAPESWRHTPFGGEIDAGRVWGRGAADTKGALAAMLFAAGRLPPSAFGGRIIMAATVCEENLTGAALSHVLDQYPAEVVVTGEPTGLRLGVAQKGRAALLVTAGGRSAHTSQPELGENAIYKMMEAARRLRAMPLPKDPDLGPSLLELTEIISEPYPNGLIVPYGCRARFIGRTLPGETQESLLEKVQTALEGLPGMEIRLAEYQQRCYTGRTLVMTDFLPGWRNPAGNPWETRILTQLAAAGLPAQRFYMPGCTNASASAGMRGIPSFIYGPGELAQAHTVDEWLALDELLAAEKGYRAILTACLGRTA